MSEVLDKVGEISSGIANKVEIVFTKIAEQIGQGADYFWPILIRQQTVEAITCLVAIIVLTMLTLISVSVCKKFYIAYSEEKLGVDPVICSCIVLGVFLIALISTVLSTSNNIVTGFINPEYGAAKDVIEMIKEIK